MDASHGDEEASGSGTARGDDVLVERRDGTVTVTLDQPKRKNAVTPFMWAKLLDTFNAIAASDTDRVVIVTGSGGDFCSGADLGAPDATAGHGLARMRRIGAACLALHNLPQPTIAKVRGVAVGAGCNLAMACDLAVASSDARFSEIFARRGLSVDFGGSWLLPRRVGMQRAKELLLLADIIDAAEADRIGLVNRVVEPADLDGFVDDWARRLAAGPPIALSMTKKLVNNAFSTSLEQALEEEAMAQTVNFSTADTNEAVQAFLSKREPRFEGR
jgi:2-(1,2-epoxy-1,2-dihydrophenyl)acetyl-CoA isomerase